jgi:L-ascorbate metabolism protein UlaG (beta-lactamase superfamily)
MKIRFVSHASVIITCDGTGIWTDPWLSSKAFNDSWTLWPPAALNEEQLEGVQYLWLSHEHPDHLNFPTLASLPASFKSRATILFQDNNPERIFAPLRKLGYQRFQILAHRRKTRIGSVCVYCYRVGTMDSCLAINGDGRTIVNLNDARVNEADHARIVSDFGQADVVLNQFSIAVKEPVVDYERHARAAARGVLESVSADHAGLGAQVTIPFASFMYFSSINNAHMNAFANRPRDVIEFCKGRGQAVAVLYPGDEYEIGKPYDSSPALLKYDKAYVALRTAPYDVPPIVELPQLTESFDKLVRILHARYPQFLLRRLRPLHIRIPDLDETVRMRVSDGSFTKVASSVEPDVIIYSQPLHYSFVQPWGVATLMTSGRFTLMKDERNWRAHKALFALNNAEVFLRPRYLLRRQNLVYFRDRWNGMSRYTERTRLHAHGKLPYSSPEQV